MTNKYMYFIANWKMFGSTNSLNSLNKVTRFIKLFKKKRSIKIIYCPPNTLIDLMSKKLKNTNIGVGSQNCYEKEDYGPYTGSVSCSMLKNVGAKYVIIGHSEVRQSGESNELINQKIQTAIKSGLKVIFCVGETIQQKRKKLTKKVLSKQIKLGLDKVRNKKSILIAYEPVWAIGSGFIPKPLELFKTIYFIKKKLKNNKVLYGGSVNNKNINQLNSISNIDGYLIGGASQNSKKFIDIIKKTYN
jgi:triosephosphate isomerase